MKKTDDYFLVIRARFLMLDSTTVYIFIGKIVFLLMPFLGMLAQNGSKFYNEKKDDRGIIVLRNLHHSIILLINRLRFKPSQLMQGYRFLV